MKARKLATLAGLIALGLVLASCQNPASPPADDPGVPGGTPNSTVQNVQGVLFNVPGYYPAYYDVSGFNNATLDAWQSVTVDLTSTPDYSVTEFDQASVDIFRIKVGLAGATAPTAAIPVVFYVKNIKVGTDGSAFNQPVTLADTWLTSSYLSEGTATLSLETVGGSPALKVNGTSSTNGYAGVEIQFGFDGGATDVDLSGAEKTISFDIYVPSLR